jgi:NodT family efflux transporter outer membrane factor (OMF) lipoprotein
MRGIEQADRFPTLDADGSTIWTRNDRHTQDSYAAGFDAAWELDIFGGIKRSIEAADADVEASVQQYGDVLISMISEIAVNYVELRTYQAQIAAVNESINTQQQTYQLTLWQYQAGLEDELATQQAKYNLESARSQLPSLNSGFNAALNRLSVLTACKPDEIRRELTELCPVPSLPSQVLVGVPADALRRRPDVRKAEKELIAQTARVGVAAAELYPKLSLGGSIGINGGSLSGLSSNLSAPADWTLQAGPRASWRIFDAGAIRQNIKVQSAKQQQALENYEAAILAAVEEVENALTAYIDEQSRFVNLQNAKQAAKEASLLASRQYEAQLIDFSEVLESQRTLLSFDNQLAQSNGTKTTNLIRLYKALGGGWQLDEAWAN